MISTFGALNGWILLQGQVPLAAAQDGLFPKPFAACHGKRGTPVFGLVVSSRAADGLMLMNYNASLVDQFTFIILLATLTTLVPYAFSAAAQLMLFFTDRERVHRRGPGPRRDDRGLAFGYSFWTICGVGRGDRRQGLPAAARRHPGVRLAEVAAAREQPTQSRPPSAPSRVAADRDARSRPQWTPSLHRRCRSRQRSGRGGPATARRRLRGRRRCAGSSCTGPAASSSG